MVLEGEYSVALRDGEEPELVETGDFVYGVDTGMNRKPRRCLPVRTLTLGFAATDCRCW